MSNVTAHVFILSTLVFLSSKENDVCPSNWVTALVLSKNKKAKVLEDIQSFLSESNVMKKQHSWFKKRRTFFKAKAPWAVFTTYNLFTNVVSVGFYTLSWPYCLSLLLTLLSISSKILLNILTDTLAFLKLSFNFSVSPLVLSH